MKNLIFAMVLTTIALTKVCAQSTEKPELLYTNKVSILFGLLQPTVAQGFNMEVNYTTKRMIFDYSHGVSLDPPTAGDFKTQNIALHIPYTTGFGIGYRFNSFFDVRFEPKLHKWEVYNKGEAQTAATKIIDFNTITLGIGAYYRFFPFKNSENKFLQGITTSTSLRYWQNVGTNLSGDKFTYLNKGTNKTETLNAPNIGIANSPIIFNIAVGYTFGGK
jgi:opacity protein-like surface antigen